MNRVQLINFVLDMLKMRGMQSPADGIITQRMNYYNEQYAHEYRMPRRLVQMPSPDSVSYPEGYTESFPLPDEAKSDGLISIAEKDCHDTMPIVSVEHANVYKRGWEDTNYTTGSPFVVWDSANASARVIPIPRPTAENPKYYIVHYHTKVRQMLYDLDQPWTPDLVRGVSAGELETGSDGEAQEAHVLLAWCYLYEHGMSGEGERANKLASDARREMRRLENTLGRIVGAVQRPVRQIMPRTRRRAWH